MYVGCTREWGGIKSVNSSKNNKYHKLIGVKNVIMIKLIKSKALSVTISHLTTHPTNSNTIFSFIPDDAVDHQKLGCLRF